MTSLQHPFEPVSKVCSVVSPMCVIVSVCLFIQDADCGYWLIWFLAWYRILLLCQNWLFVQTYRVNRVLSFSSDCTWPDVVVQWCSQGDLLAVAGMERTLLSADPSCPPLTRNAIVKFYNVRGDHIYTLDTPAQVPNTVAATAFVLLNPRKCL